MSDQIRWKEPEREPKTHGDMSHKGYYGKALVFTIEHTDEAGKEPTYHLFVRTENNVLVLYGKGAPLVFGDVDAAKAKASELFVELRIPQMYQRVFRER